MAAIAAAGMTAPAPPLGWRHHWEQGQNQWGWGDWGSPNGTGLVISCPDDSGDGEPTADARIDGDHPHARVIFSNGSAYYLPIPPASFGHFWADLRASVSLTMVSADRRVVVPSSEAGKVMPATVCQAG